jgi:hypothetical protein
MQGNRTFLEGLDIHPLFWEQDANTDITGDWLGIANYGRAYILLDKAGSEQVDDLGLQILQAKDNAGTGAKGMLVSRAWYKAGTMTAQGLWTAVALGPSDFLAFGTNTSSGGVSYATTVDTRVIPDATTLPFSMLVEIRNVEFDQANGFKYFTAFIEGDNVNNTCLITAQGILMDCGIAGAIPPNPTT